jgi:hypothetical protein
MRGGMGNAGLRRTSARETSLVLYVASLEVVLVPEVETVTVGLSRGETEGDAHGIELSWMLLFPIEGPGLW